MIPLEDDCDECVPEYMVQRGVVKTLISALPFLLTFFVVALGVSQKLFPILSGHSNRKAHHSDARLPGASSRERASLFKSLRLNTRSLAAIVFSINIALSAVLAELIFCEITNAGNRATRTLALKLLLPSLLFLLVVATPALEIHSVVSGTGLDAGGSRRKAAWILDVCGLTVWLAAFWYLGSGLLGTYLHEESYIHDHTFSEGCLERIGVIGISMMASLTGFAAVSSLWQTFGVRYRPVTDSDIGRKQAGIQATNDMLLAKESRLRAVERKLSDYPQEGLMGRVVGTFRGNPDLQERNMLQLEIQGLETMRNTLQSSQSLLQNRRQTQLRSHTAYGRVLNAFSFVFALYCAYRIVATSITTLRRFSSSSASFASSDPINNFLALLAKHWDPTIDRVAWSRTISFLLSGVILLLSFNAVLQTFYLFSRAAPGILHHAQANFALLISQIAATVLTFTTPILNPPTTSTMSAPQQGRQSPEPENQSDAQKGQQAQPNQQGAESKTQQKSDDQKSGLPSNPTHILAEHSEETTSKKA
ncbi:hypothetical protein E8E13_003060 [Curvularia kusanoi]|uniref:Uncharacterized protein n=1 Tax=Curvularia kusanoi TaxID=90978 RepID=A0A9P4TJT2_CURKU|nr:hypothetical protein E8E13_003060 [Curvularia kusanoi]